MSNRDLILVDLLLHRICNSQCIGKDSDQLVNIGYGTLYLLLNCQGDCNTDDNCRDGLNCYQRDEFESGLQDVTTFPLKIGITVLRWW